jgi:hypothetical protein
MSGQFPPESRWSVCSGKQLKSDPFRGGQFVPESGGQFDRILHLRPLKAYFNDNKFDVTVTKKEEGCAYIKVRPYKDDKE